MLFEVDLQALRRGVKTGLKLHVPDGQDTAWRGPCWAWVLGQPRDGEQRLDAAAVLERHAQRGARLAEGLKGSYAIAVVDTEAAALGLWSDRMAVHTWCHAVDQQRARVSPRADWIAQGADLDPQALFTYLSSHVIPSPDTVFAGVHRLPPAHHLSLDAQGLHLRRHWTPDFQETPRPDLNALKEEFRTLVQSSVRREATRLGERVGTFLSGGTDSSTVSGMLSRLLQAPVRAYSIGFDANGYDEMAYARMAARHFGLEHREHYLTPAEVADGMPHVAGSYDQPFGNSSAVAAYHCARVAREDGRDALLAGDGGDELFGGNARYAKQSLFGLYDDVPAAVRGLLLEPALCNPVARNAPVLRKAASYIQQAKVPMPDRLHQYNLLRRLGLHEVLTPAFRAQVNPDRELQLQREVYGHSEGAHLVNRMLAFDWRYTLADNDLPKVVGTTGLAGIGTAFPMLSDELIDFSLKLPHGYKLKGMKLRWFFKEALRGFLPDDILRKKKQGFGLPFGVWALRDPDLAALADEALASFGTRGVVNPAFMQRLRTELLPAHPGYYGELVWILAMLEFWLRAHRPDWKLAA